MSAMQIVDLSRNPLEETMPPWRLLLDPRGRINRGTFWRWGVGALLGLGLLGHALLGIARVPADTADRLISLLLVWPAIAISAKRWHDRDRAGWWVLVALLPVIGWIWSLLDNGCVPGSKGANRFGPAPAEH
jgi:uncharacterized membrane protein YhaH (DUF805 family)